jgi:hypothetical protein
MKHTKQINRDELLLKINTRITRKRIGLIAVLCYSVLGYYHLDIPKSFMVLTLIGYIMGDLVCDPLLEIKNMLQEFMTCNDASTEHISSDNE